jgi:hypothetical protein
MIKKFFITKEIYENYYKTPPVLYKSLNPSLAIEWWDKKFLLKKKRKTKLNHFYKILYKLKKKKLVNLKNWTFIKKKFTHIIPILKTTSIRNLNLNSLYKLQDPAVYKTYKLNGYTFNNEKILNNYSQVYDKYKYLKYNICVQNYLK